MSGDYIDDSTWENNIHDARLVAMRIERGKVEIKLSTSHIISIEADVEHGEFQGLEVTSRPSWEDEWTFGT